MLDEPSSGLDMESERLVFEGVRKLLENKTTFVIAHRMSTIQNADRILVLDQGRLVESGTHAELLARGGVYSQLQATQAAEPRPSVTVESQAAIYRGLTKQTRPAQSRIAVTCAAGRNVSTRDRRRARQSPNRPSSKIARAAPDAGVEDLALERFEVRVGARSLLDWGTATFEVVSVQVTSGRAEESGDRIHQRGRPEAMARGVFGMVDAQQRTPGRIGVGRFIAVGVGLRNRGARTPESVAVLRCRSR